MNPIPWLTTVLSVIIAGPILAQQENFPKLTGQYLGQTPPDTKAEIFAPGIISTDVIEAGLTFSHDGRYLVFRRGFRADTEIYLSENRAGTWTNPVPAPFFVKEYGFGDFTFSPNEPVLYFTSRRPLEQGQATTDSANLWQVEYDNEGWSLPSPIADILVTPLHESYPSVANDKTLYFFRRFDDENGNYELMYSEFKNAAYSAPARMGEAINTEWEEWDPSVAPDSSFLVFCSKRPSSLGQDDLYVSFRTPDGGWTDALNLGDGVNSEQSENRPFITADGKYLFFNRGNRENRNVYWVDLGVVRRLAPAAR